MVRGIAVFSVLTPALAFAQVSVNTGALDDLKEAPPAQSAPKPEHRPPAHPVRPKLPRPVAHAEHAQTARPVPPSPPEPATKASKLKPGLPPPVPPAPPSVAVLPPVMAPVQTRPPAPPPPVPMQPDAVGEASPIQGGVRITFGDGSSNLNPATEAALRKLAQTVKADPNADLNVYAYAAGVPDDPSTPRRLSLSRALAVRAVLIGEGIESTRIYPRALGATPSDGPPNHVDVTQAALAPPPTSAPQGH